MPFKCAPGDSLLVIYGKKRRTHFAHPDHPETPVCGRGLHYLGNYGQVTAVDESNVLADTTLTPPKRLIECVDCGLSYRAAPMHAALPDERKAEVLEQVREIIGKENLLKKLTAAGVFKP